MQRSSSNPESPLQHFIGSWRGEVTVEGAAAEPRRYTQENSFSWTLGERFLQENGRGSDGSAFLGLWSLDAQNGTYRAHYFLAPSGDVVTLTHEWREATRSFVGSAELGGGIKMLAEDRFIDDDTYEWSITVQDPAERILSRMHARVHRVSGSGAPGLA